MKDRRTILILLIIIMAIQLLLFITQIRALYEIQNLKLKTNIIKVECQMTPTKVCEDAKQSDKENQIKTKKVWLKETDGSHIKPFMDYNLITDKTSKQYKFIHRNDVQEDKRGFLMQDNEWYCVALGSYFGEIGSKYIFTLENGKEIKVVKSEAKSDKHTDEDNYLSFNGHIIEFLINTNSTWMENNDVIYNGSLNVYDKLQGSVVSIEEVLS